MSIEVRTVCANGAEMNWFSFGSGTGTMVIIPGLSLLNVCDYAEAIAAAYSGFTDDYTLYLIDRRRQLPPVYGAEDMAWDTAAALDKLGIRGAYMFGVSQGGMIAQLIASQRPELVDALVLGSTAARLSDAHKAQIMRWVDAAKRGDAEALVTQFAGAVYSPGYYERYRRAFGALAKMLTKEHLDRFSVLAGSIGSFDIYDRLGGIRCPTLVIGAENDEVLGADPSREISERLGCELYIYENGFHAAYDEEPDYKDRILGFFRKCRTNC